jgi:hypothetical protein
VQLRIVRPDSELENTPARFLDGGTLEAQPKTANQTTSLAVPIPDKTLKIHSARWTVPALQPGRTYYRNFPYT